ncbi:hydantoinase/oxoprolinase family protein [Saccharomonospora sp. NPDC046836]|uniref:hydantoinase/oxoprolinase family protein n=1 Tax=Saccharomonospora sp. NPDC046836 TaxID=3156921 RepID=UPI0033F6E94C
MTTAEKWRLAVDVGGTFIDYILLDESDGSVHVEKQAAKAATLVDEFVGGMRRLPAKPGDISRFIHGTTVALNTLVQERGALTGLITTQGFRDVLELGRGGRAEIYNFRYQPARPLVDRYLRREIPGRMGPDGTELVPLELSRVDSEVDYLLAHGATAIAICLLHSYVNPDHEQRIADRIRARHPEIAVSVSSELVREWREYERTSTTVINAFTQPLFANYARSIDERMRAEGLTNPIAFMRSNGGVMPITSAADRPVETLGSGPAGGVIGAHTLMAQAGYRNVVCADVGGTTYDVALIQDGEIVERADTIVAGRPIMGSVIDIVSVGAGGGSIASIDPVTASLKVGPESAGAQPGPACFGIGGTKPTVTDAQVILGLLDPDRFLGKRMVLDRALAEQAITGHLGTARTVSDYAAGIMAVAQANMANAIRQITTQRGLDPRDFVMLSYGGGGGLFAAGVCEELGVHTVLVPQAAAGFSAWGMLTADYREDSTITSVTDVAHGQLPGIVDNYAKLREEATAALVGYGFASAQLELGYSADVRFLGQEHTITTPLEPDWLADGAAALPAALQQRFVERHRQRYGHGEDDAEIQIVTFRCRAIAPVAKPVSRGRYAEVPAVAVASRPIWFPEGGWHDEVPVYERDALSATDRIEGPAVIDEWTTTVVVPPRWTALLDELGNLVLTFEEESK